jgi:hypothetical protein
MTAAGAQPVFKEADTDGKRKVLGTVLLNATLSNGHIASYQLKHPFGSLL